MHGLELKDDSVLNAPHNWDTDDFGVPQSTFPRKARFSWQERAWSERRTLSLVSKQTSCFAWALHSLTPLFISLCLVVCGFAYLAWHFSRQANSLLLREASSLTILQVGYRTEVVWKSWRPVWFRLLDRRSPCKAQFLETSHWLVWSLPWF